MRQQEQMVLSEEEYLRWEARQPTRHEYVAGAIHAMTGASLRHNVIALNFATLLRQHLRGSPCRVFMEGVKLKIAKSRLYYYPDLFVTCDPRLLGLDARTQVAESARVVVEVLSPASEGIDRREKQHAYRSLPELTEYVLVSQEAMQIEIHRRRGDIGWILIQAGPGDAVELAGIEFSAPIEVIYEESGVTPEDRAPAV